MNRTTLILIATAASGAIAVSSPLPAQERVISVAWSPTTPPTIIAYGAVKIALNPPQGEWNALVFSRKSTVMPWQQTYYWMKTAPFMNGTIVLGLKQGPTTSLPAVQLRMQANTVFLEYPVGFSAAATATAVATAAASQRSLTTAMGANEAGLITAIWSGLDSVVKTTPSLRDLGLNEIPVQTPTFIGHVETGQTLSLDGGRRLMVAADRLVLMSGTQYQRSWPAATSWVLKTADQRISVIEKVGYTK